ncbi:MAG: BspA family leucine-rich repeat surface protein [Bacilli bacterium]|nr:BspA family leucine-rich repeat surface protein [Bacilli bacterium]
MKKGFTLIELLAVIVILAVIALVAVPSIMGIITKAKRGAAENSAYNYVKALETSVVTSQLNGDNLTGHYDVIELEDKVLLKGTKPSKGNVTLANTGKIEEASLCINNLEISYNGTHAKVVADNCDNISIILDGNYLMTYKANDYFWKYPYDYSLISISFVNYIDTTNAIEYWDVSEEQNGSIIAWIIEDTKIARKHNLYIGSNKTILANPDSSEWFYHLYNVTSINFNNYDTSNVINMSAMFYGMDSLTSLDVSNFDTSNVTDMSSMFESVRSLTSLDVSNFDTSNVTDMSSMFETAHSLTSLDLSNFDTSKVTDMSSMFIYNNSLTSLDLSNFDTSNVIHMHLMFADNEKLQDLNISSFDTSNVITISGMFCNSPGLIDIDTSHFNTSKMTDLYEIFSCNLLPT